MNTTPCPEALAAPALVPPALNQQPLPEYGYDRLDYGMTIGIERTPGGRLWACWVGGGDSEKAFFVLATSDDGGTNWSDPCLVIDPHDDDTLGMARRVIVGTLWLDPRGRLWLFFDQAMTFYDGRAGTWYTRCDDPDAAEPRWSAPERIWHGCLLNKPIVTRNGEWLLPISLWDRQRIIFQFKAAFHDLDPLRGVNLLVSKDEGKSWQRRGGVSFPNPEYDEAHLIERGDGSLWLTARTRFGLWESVSSDHGATWSEPNESVIGNTNSRHYIRRLRSGRILLVKHGVELTEPPVRGPYVNGSRSMLTAFLSDDDGATWQGGLVLDERNGISYPDGTQIDDGTILVSYDYQRDTHGHILFARFSEEAVLARSADRPDVALRQLISRPDPEAVKRRHAPEA